MEKKVKRVYLKFVLFGTTVTHKIHQSKKNGKIFEQFMEKGKKKREEKHRSPSLPLVYLSRSLTLAKKAKTRSNRTQQCEFSDT